MNRTLSPIVETYLKYVDFIFLILMYGCCLSQQNINIDDHDEMTQNYINIMTEMLQNMFSGLSPEAAYALAWGGLEGTYWYNHPDQLHQVPTYQDGINTLYRQHTYNGKTFGHGF